MFKTIKICVIIIIILASLGAWLASKFLSQPRPSNFQTTANLHDKKVSIENFVSFPSKPPDFTDKPVDSQQLATCLLSAAETYHVPSAVLIGIMKVEDGQVGLETAPDAEGNYSMGPMRIGSKLLAQSADAWKVDVNTARKWIRDDGCINVQIAAWILQKKIVQGGNLNNGIALYHSDVVDAGKNYAKAVIKVMNEEGLISVIKKDITKTNEMTVTQLNIPNGCKLKIDAIVCIEGPTSPVVTGNNAAAVYQIYGFNTDTIHQSYAQAFLKAHNCTSVGSSPHVIKEMGHGKIATPTGWVELTEADMDEKWQIVTASNYLTGQCEKFKAKNEHYQVPLSINPQ